MSRSPNLNKRTLDKSRDYAYIAGATGFHARYEQDGLYFDQAGAICKQDRMRPEKGEPVAPYAQPGQDPVPAAQPLSPETRVPIVVDGRQVMMTIAEAAEAAGFVSDAPKVGKKVIGKVHEDQDPASPKKDEDPQPDPDQEFAVAVAGNEGAIALSQLSWPDLQKACSELDLDGPKKDDYFASAAAKNITHVRRL